MFFFWGKLRGERDGGVRRRRPRLVLGFANTELNWCLFSDLNCRTWGTGDMGV